MKRKIPAILAVLLIALSFAACGEKTENKEAEKTEDLSRPAQSEEKTVEPEKEIEPAEAEDEKGNEQSNPADEESNKAEINLGDIRTAILNSCSITDSMPLETDALTRLYSIDASKVKQSASFVTMSGTFPHEIIMTEAIDAKAAADIAACLENRLSEVRVQSKSYDAENYALAQKCRVVTNGSFVSLFLSPMGEKMLSVYTQYIK